MNGLKKACRTGAGSGGKSLLNRGKESLPFLQKPMNCVIILSLRFQDGEPEIQRLTGGRICTGRWEK